MRERNLKRLFTGLLVVVLSVALVYPQSQSVIGQGFHFDATKLKDPNLWTQVNEQPHYLSSTVDSLCRITHRRDFEFERKRNPHASTYITVYVNKIGREAMFATGAPRFPEGSVIVKEKIEKPLNPDGLNIGPKEPLENLRPSLYTLMIKREPGYNPAVGDWEFAVTSGKDFRIEASGKLESCQACHLEKRDQDFVFRYYLKPK
jgi:cytochrome P460